MCTEHNFDQKVKHKNINTDCGKCNECQFAQKITIVNETLLEKDNRNICDEL